MIGEDGPEAIALWRMQSCVLHSSFECDCLAALHLQMMGGVQKVGSSSKKQGRSKRKSLMDLLEQVRAHQYRRLSAIALIATIQPEPIYGTEFQLVH